MLDYGDYKKPLPDPCTLIVRFVPARVGSDMPSVSPEENHTPGTTWYIKISVNPIILIQTLLNLLIIIKTNNSNWKSIHTFEVSIISSNSGQVGQNLSKCIISWGKNCVSPICKYSVSRYLFQTQNIWLFVSKRHNAKVWLPPPPSLSLYGQTDFQKNARKITYTHANVHIFYVYILKHFRILPAQERRTGLQNWSRGSRDIPRLTCQRASTPSRWYESRRLGQFCLRTLCSRLESRISMDKKDMKT